MRRALSHRAFRWVFAGTLASNIGTWMQNVTLIALAYDLTGGATFIGIVTFAQLGPMLVLSPIGGLVADRVDRRVLMVTIAAGQALLSLGLAVLATQEQPNKAALVALVAGIGIGGALNGPAAAATLPALVEGHDIQGAVALNSASMNASRVAGPILGGLTAVAGGATLVFAINAATYLFVIVALLIVQADFSPKGHRGESPLRQVADGLVEARRDPVIAKVLVTIAVYSLFSLVFIYQMPLIAAEQFGLDDQAYTLLFATFGLGALIGALAIGSFLAGHDRARMVRAGLLVFSAALAVFALSNTSLVGFPAVFLCGASYFVVVTALVTILQLRVANEVRGRVMGLWMMAWAGLVPVGGLLAGPLIDRFGMTVVLMVGAAVSLLLAATVNLHGPPRAEDALTS
jgi:MFS family permease